MNRTPGTPDREELTWVGTRGRARPRRRDDPSSGARGPGRRPERHGTGRARPRDLRETSTAPAGDRDGTLQLDAVDAATTDLRASMVSIPHAGADWPWRCPPTSTIATRSWTRRRGSRPGSRTTGRRSRAAPSTRRRCARCSSATTSRPGRGRRRAPPVATRPRSTAWRVRRHDRRRRAPSATAREDVGRRDAHDWIDRNAGYDAALRHLYHGPHRVKGPGDRPGPQGVRRGAGGAGTAPA
jgi:hypothetical protein